MAIKEKYQLTNDIKKTNRINKPDHKSAVRKDFKDIKNETVLDAQPQNEASKRDLVELKEKSIFYDKDWNAEGKAPFDLRNIPYNSKTFVRRGPPINPMLAGLDTTNIPEPIESNH
ncbi:hypothetical protein NCAS_0B02160 [Naumovozyma castellii]|uniref:Uncharacterized protein n=1 Tax=Naumovozyma castellii TaxID=27288 RepID=G0VBH4_NAUCA|nr:hypothetical protein NCAS_0B02160 [Naumovozyma castellii CBS 4309]CCC68300.1 hypothetical protein NCAS_0B02160 [Naumovozyma castellii CBS 4309]